MMQFDFTGKHAVVTGGSRGIGRAIAEKLLAMHCSVVITSTRGVPEWIAAYLHASHISINFLNAESVRNGIKHITALGRIDILVNNAGIHGPQAVDEIDDETWSRILEVNVSAPMRMMRAVAPTMKAQKRGWILNISSISGIIARKRGSAYSASKAGLIGLTRAAALDLAPHGVLVNALCPGATQTDMFDLVLNPEQKEILRAESALKRIAQPEEIANVAAFLCSELNTYITGQAVVVDGGATIQ